MVQGSNYVCENRKSSSKTDLIKLYLLRQKSSLKWVHGITFTFKGDLLFCLQRIQEEIIYGRTNQSLNFLTSVVQWKVILKLTFLIWAQLSVRREQKPHPKTEVLMDGRGAKVEWWFGGGGRQYTDVYLHRFHSVHHRSHSYQPEFESRYLTNPDV
jgi:hypothetical protein